MMVKQVPQAEADAVRTELHRFMASRPDLTLGHVAAHTLLCEGTVRAFASGHLPGGREAVTAIARVMESARAGDILTPGGRPAVVLAEDMGKRVRRLRREGTFYSTQLSRRVAETLEYCHEQQAIGIVTADFGCGKTAAVRHWREQNAGRVSCTVMECDEFCSTNKLDFVRSLAKLYGITRKVGTMNGGLVFEELCEQVRENPGLIVIDQTETLAARCCQIIRQLWDKTSDAGVGVVMLAAPILLERLMAGRTADLGALQSRVGIWVPLSGLTRSEMAAIVRQEGIVDVDEAAFDVWNKAIGGSIRRLMRSIDLLKSRHAGKRVSETTVAGVAGHLWGLNLSKAA